MKQIRYVRITLQQLDAMAGQRVRNAFGLSKRRSHYRTGNKPLDTAFCKWTAEDATREFWRLVAIKRPNDCWEFKGRKYEQGYGRTTVGGPMERSHRFAWITVNGPIPKDGKILHHCDNPPCCNPRHLYLGTQKDNVRDVYMRQTSSRAFIGMDGAEQVRQLFASGMKVNQIARKLGYGHTSVSNILRGKTWLWYRDKVDGMEARASENAAEINT